MKKILPIIILICLISTGYTWPFKKKEIKPTTQQSQTEVVKVKPTIQDGRNLVKEISAELKVAKDENIKLKNNLEKATQKLQQAELKIQEVQKAADSLKQWGIEQQAEAQKYFDKYTKAVKRYHRLKWIAAIIAAAVGVLLGLQFMNLAPPPYNLGVPVGAAALFAALVWFFL
jgi:ElaB/YqjD/DUF883 family membrane-anchored ribosome-binding protein